MRVKRLEIQGFKSFKDKTVVHFDHGITGIVGPNGCGKSNIVDAFFWVMGEQSNKHMRASNSADLIFNGSSKYSPLGMAEATIVMEMDVVDTENAPAGASASPDLGLPKKTKEVSVTRRVYRTGEGEYFINGVSCRLKDVHELFMDTGVGAKGYSVIEQGQIGRIIQSKPEDRRLLIEEAAGVAKYKARKKESLKKMEAAQGNLSRLNDVVQEIERNLNSLERQAQKARKYKEYKKELFEKEMTWGRRKSQVMRAQLDALRKEKNALEQELVGLRAELQTAENSIETDRVEQLTDSKMAEDLQAEIQELAAELSQAETSLELSRRRQDDLSRQLISLESERDELEQAIATERMGLEEREAGAFAAQEELETMAERVRETEQQLREKRAAASQSRNESEARKREMMAGISESTKLTSLSATLEARIDAAKSQLVKLTAQEEQLKERIDGARQQAADLREQYETLRQERIAREAEEEAYLEQAETLEGELKLLEKEREQAHKIVTQLASKLESLEELAAAHEGLGNGPKAVLDWANESGRGERFKVLADLIEVSAGYEKAVEGWLDARLESLVAESADVAVEAIAHLREAKQGRAVFHLGVDGAAGSVGSFESARAAFEAAGFEVLGELSSFVKTADSAAGSRVSRVFGNVCVVRAIAPVQSHPAAGWALVSMDGDVLEADGTLRGGSTESDSSASILGRKRAIQELQEKVAEARTQYEALAERTDSKREELETAMAKSRELQQKVQELEVQAAAMERDVQQAERTLRDTENQIHQVELEISDLRGREQEAALELEEVKGKVEELTARRVELEAGITELSERLAAEEDALRQSEAELQDIRIHEASLRERTQSVKREVEAARSFIENRERRLAQVRELLDKLSVEREEHSGGDEGVGEQIGELNQLIAEKKEALSAVRDRLEQSSAKLNGFYSRTKELHKAVDTKGARVSELAVEVERASGDLNHLVRNLEEKYGAGCLDNPVAGPIQEEMTEPVVTQEMSEEEERQLGEEVEQLRERIRRLGEVNTMAIEEYEELKKRYDYLREERVDLEHSIDNLEAAIEHINKTSKDRFAKAFEAISKRFERLFPIIFGGGRAELSLVYPEGSTDILDAGVDILAQPPGKKIVNIGLLSGGEKALTALSLLFAIFMVKPSPFCILDEVDAPLDDGNIGKFNALLREMAAKSQFIVITHNKKTMELNDALFGVTMEEPGVSKMVSIEMR